MKVIIDRFEENIAVVELNGEMLNAPRALFGEAREGDVVELRILPRSAADPDASEKAEDDAIAPAAEASDDPAAKAEQVRAATMRLFGFDQPKQETPDEENPAAMFKKLRNKKKNK